MIVLAIITFIGIIDRNNSSSNGITVDIAILL